jgi:hypothetical protein
MRSPLVRWCPPAITLVLMLGCLVGCGTAESTTRAAGTATRVVLESGDVGTPPAPPIPSDSLPSSDAPPPTDPPPGGAPTANPGPGPAPGGSSGTGAGGRTPGPDGDCPDLPSATSSAVAVDYVDLVQWQGRTYYAAGVYGSVAAVEPLLQVRGLRADRRRVAVAGEHDGVGRQGQEAGRVIESMIVGKSLNDRPVAPGPPLKRVSPEKSTPSAGAWRQHAPGACPGVCSVQLDVADGEGLTVGELSVGGSGGSGPTAPGRPGAGMPWHRSCAHQVTAPR